MANVIWELRSTKFGKFHEGRAPGHRFQIRLAEGYALYHRLEGDPNFEHLASLANLADAKFTAEQWVARPELRQTVYGQ